MPSDLSLTHSPGWTWLVISYFFFGGLAGGSYAIAALIDLFGRPADKPLARLGYLIALPALVPCAPLLMLDLARPERFWHMLLQSDRLPLPMFKWWSPMSAGSWALTTFGLFALLSFLGALDWAPFRWVRRGVFARVIPAIGAVFAFFVASYTGVLLMVTNRPIWADTPLLGMLFLVSGVSTAAALMMLLGYRRGWAARSSLACLERMDNWVMVLELVVLLAMLATLGPVVSAFRNAWGVLLVVGVIVVGLLLPLLLHWRPGILGGRTVAAASVLALLGGFILRVVIVMASEQV